MTAALTFLCVLVGIAAAVCVGFYAGMMHERAESLWGRK